LKSPSNKQRIIYFKRSTYCIYINSINYFVIISVIFLNANTTLDAITNAAVSTRSLCCESNTGIPPTFCSSDFSSVVKSPSGPMNSKASLGGFVIFAKASNKGIECILLFSSGIAPHIINLLSI